MGVAYNPEIITNGLQLCLDAGNTKSYPGSGTSWSDISGNSRNFTLNGAISYGSTNGGYLGFNSATEYTVSNTVLSLATTEITVDIWLKVYTHGNWNDFVANNWVNNGWLMFASTTQWLFGVGNGGSQYIAASNHSGSTSWTNLVGTYDGTTVKIYINGVVSATTATVAGVTLNTGYSVYVGSAGDPGPYDISCVKVYNTALTAAQIVQNFNALRARYGI